MLPQHENQGVPLLKSAVDQAKEAVVIMDATIEDPGPRILYVNPAFTEITGYEPEEVIGQPLRLLEGPDTEPWVMQRLCQQLRKGKPFEGEAINYRKDGTPYVNQCSIAPVRNENDTITHWVSVQRDVTERRRMGENLLKAQEQERHRMAQWIHDELGGLLTSLQISINHAQVRSDAGPQLNELLTGLEARIDSISAVVRSLTGLASPRVLEDYGLTEAIHRLTSMVEQSHGLTVHLHNELEYNERLSPLLERVAYRVLREALLNAGRHAQTDSAQVLLNKTPRQLRLHIVDQGSGFDPSQELSTEDNYGLAGIKARVQRLNGTFSIQTAPGEGTRITITLPPTLVSLP